MSHVIFCSATEKGGRCAHTDYGVMDSVVLEYN